MYVHELSEMSIEVNYQTISLLRSIVSLDFRAQSLIPYAQSSIQEKT